MSSWAKPGVKCVCIRETPWIDGATLNVVDGGPAKSEICTIVFVATHPEHGIGLCLTGYRETDGRPSIYPIQFFRPLVDQEDDVALFASFLDLVGEPA